MEKYFGENVPKLGFGLMRLPGSQGGGKIDVEETKQMVDLFMESGFTYFDTAYVYDNGDSEKVTKAALVDRYPRDSYTLATKINAWLGEVDEESTKKQFEISLERTGAGYFDYYLLHALQSSSYMKYEDYKIWDYVKEQKAKGLIKHWGFSFHSSPEILEEVLNEHPDSEFVQLQINYADWENPGVASRRCYEIARKYGKSVIIMEPVKGGKLANPIPKVQDIFKEVNPNASMSSWAIRYAASLDGIITVLSGMSNIAQMKDNISFMKDFKPLDEREMEAIKKAQEAMNDNSIPCTACKYCTSGCPVNIPIPDIFEAMNLNLSFNNMEEAKKKYSGLSEKGNVADACIACGQCENACPQQIKIIDRLKECQEALG